MFKRPGLQRLYPWFSGTNPAFEKPAVVALMTETLLGYDSLAPQLEHLKTGLRDGHSQYQRVATPEGTAPNMGHRVRDGQVNQRAATQKGTTSDVRHRVWDGQVCQRAATLKGTIANVGH